MAVLVDMMDRVCQQKEGGALYEQILLNNQGMSDEPRAKQRVTKSCPQEGCFDWAQGCFYRR